MQMWCCTDIVEADTNTHFAENRNWLKNVIYILYIHTTAQDLSESYRVNEPTKWITLPDFTSSCLTLCCISGHNLWSHEFPPSVGDRSLIGRMWHAASFTSPAHSEVIALQVVRTPRWAQVLVTGYEWMHAFWSEERNSLYEAGNRNPAAKAHLFSDKDSVSWKKTWDTLAKQALGGLLILC